MVNKLLKKSASWIQKEHQSILSAAAIISASYMASALLGLVRNRLLAARFFGGLESDLDIYFAASIIPDTIFQLLVVGALSAAFVPIYQEYYSRSPKDANHMANATLTTFTVILVGLTILLIIFANPVTQIIATYPSAQTQLMANLMRIMALAQIFFTISAFLTGVLQSQRRFLIPAIAPIFYNLGTIIGIYILSPHIGIYSAAIGIVFGSVLHLAIQIPQAKTLGYLPRIIFAFRHPGSITIFQLMPLRSAALGISQFERFVSVSLATPLIAGSLTMFSFARALYLLPIALFGMALGQASFPSLSHEANMHNDDRFRETLSKSILQTLFFSIPASILLIVLRVPIVRIAYGAQNFPWEATLLTGKALAILAVNIAPQAAAHVLVRSFYARKDTKTPLLISLSTIIIFIVLGIVFTRVYSLGIIGIALALGISDLFDFLLLYIFISRKVGRLKLGLRFIKMITSGFFTALFLWAPMRLLDQFVFDTTRTLPLMALTVIVSLIGGAVYLGLSALFKVEEFTEFSSTIKKLGNWRRVLDQSDEVLETPTT